jgi:hypothetical protein
MKYKKISHIRYRKKIIIMIFLVGISITLLPDASGYFLPKNNLELYLENELIVLGKVLSSSDVVDESNYTPRTAYEIKILQHVKGHTETKEITVMGLGSLNSTRQVDNQTILSEGQQVLLMLNGQDDGGWFISPYSFPSDSLYPDSQFILPPLKLYKAGLSVDEINCKSSLKLALKSINDSPVCLTPESFDKLFEREWIK